MKEKKMKEESYKKKKKHKINGDKILEPERKI